MRKNISIVIIIVLLLVLLGGLVLFQKSDQNTVNSNTITDNSKISVEYTSDELLGEYTNYSAEINLDSMTLENGGGVSISGTTISISSAGVYHLTGTASEGNVVVNAHNQEVVLVLDNVNITCSTTSVVNVIDAKKVTINIPEGTTSILTDSSKYSVFTEDDEPNATIFSKDDISIDGKGTLVINANYEDAIASKDGLKIVRTTLNITSVDDGIRGKDYVAIKDATITVKSTGKAIKATEETDTTLGFIVIDGGTFSIESEDDALHSNNGIVINDGDFSIIAGDDGIHADSSIFINGGTINIAKSYEGIEANYIEINGGNVSVIASDDGININGGNDNMGMMRQDAFRAIAGENTEDDSNRMLVINGGNLIVEANGDGLDSNGSIKMTGGTILVGASTNGGNGALDYNNTFIISGGTLIAYGPTGMWQNPSNSSTQYSIAFTVTGKVGDKVELKDSNGNVIESFTAKRAYGMVCISTEALMKGKIYELYINGEGVASQELTSTVTSNVNFENGFGGGFMDGGRGDFQMNDGERADFQMGSGDIPQMPSEKGNGNMPQFQNENGERPQRPTDGNGEMSRGKKSKKEMTIQSDDNTSNTEI